MKKILGKISSEDTLESNQPVETKKISLNPDQILNDLAIDITKAIYNPDLKKELQGIHRLHPQFIGKNSVIEDILSYLPLQSLGMFARASKLTYALVKSSTAYENAKKIHYTFAEKLLKEELDELTQKIKMQLLRTNTWIAEDKLDENCFYLHVEQEKYVFTFIQSDRNLLSLSWWLSADRLKDAFIKTFSGVEIKIEKTNRPQVFKLIVSQHIIKVLGENYTPIRTRLLNSLLLQESDQAALTFIRNPKNGHAWLINNIYKLQKGPHAKPKIAKLYLAVQILLLQLIDYSNPIYKTSAMDPAQLKNEATLVQIAYDAHQFLAMISSYINYVFDINTTLGKSNLIKIQDINALNINEGRLIDILEDGDTVLFKGVMDAAKAEKIIKDNNLPGLIRIDVSEQKYTLYFSSMDHTTNLISHKPIQNQEVKQVCQKLYGIWWQELTDILGQHSKGLLSRDQAEKLLNENNSEQSLIRIGRFGTYVLSTKNQQGEFEHRELKTTLAANDALKQLRTEHQSIEFNK